MTDPLAQFCTNLQQARDLVGLARAIDAQTSGALSTDDIVRGALVGGVSALDHFVHELVRTLLVAQAEGSRPRSLGFQRFSISARAALDAAGGVPASKWMDEEVRRRHGHLSFQQPDKIAAAVGFVWDGKLWAAVAREMGTDPASARRSIQVVVLRRNRIVHEADRHPATPNERWPITTEDVTKALSSLEALVFAIQRVVATHGGT
ncbi:MAG: hypothetical protein R2878_14030 [Thermoleophilia bacterium]